MDKVNKYMGRTSDSCFPVGKRRNRKNRLKLILKDMDTLPTLVSLQQVVVSFCLDTWSEGVLAGYGVRGSKCYKIQPLHYFYLLVLILRHTENKGNSLKYLKAVLLSATPLKHSRLISKDRVGHVWAQYRGNTHTDTCVVQDAQAVLRHLITYWKGKRSVILLCNISNLLEHKKCSSWVCSPALGRQSTVQSLRLCCLEWAPHHTTVHQKKTQGLLSKSKPPGSGGVHL